MSDESPTPGARRRSWPRLAALLFLVALVCLIIAWTVQPKGVAATALFEVRSDTPSLVGNQPAGSNRESDFKILKNTQLALLKSKFVLTSALVNPGTAALAVFAGKPDPVAWLQDHLEVSYPQNGEILEIKLRGTNSQADDLVHVVEAVADAYRTEVLGAEKTRKLALRDMVARSLETLNGELKRKYDDYLDIAKAMNLSVGSIGVFGEADSGAKSIGLSGGSSDIQQELDLKRLDRADEELTQLERDQLKIETGGDAKDAKFVKQRIEQLHKRQDQLQHAIQARTTRSVDLITRKSELDQLQRLADDMSIKLEQMDINLEVPPRIRQIGPVTIEPRQVADR